MRAILVYAFEFGDSCISDYLFVHLSWCKSVQPTEEFSYEKSGESRTEVKSPGGLAFVLVASGTFFFYLESVLYVALVFMDQSRVFEDSLFHLRFSIASQAQLLGCLVTCLGFGLFVWSVLARGRFATSWEMPSDQVLVTWGPYRFVRHPSYLAYFIMFIGFFLLVLNLLAVIPLVAIPGYVMLVDKEEELLIRRFGEEFVEYRRKTGRFLPRRKP